ncbi:hypothetical protein H0H87_009045 [Tephrocybe sp. NHM501043]|nr:hypothetical protein H0H87_009045 [Tephrocybe sp. NHM501043]
MYCLLILPFLFTLVAAVPAFNDGTNRQTTISSLVGPSATYIEALWTTRKDADARTDHLSLNKPGPGNLTILPNARSPPLFYIHREQLWQFNNETSILYVNAINSTEATGYPVQFVVDTKPAGFKSGSWHWRGTMLHYDQGPAGKSGVFYSCRLVDGSYGVFTFLTPAATPEACRAFTMHTWSRSHINPYTPQ